MSETTQNDKIRNAVRESYGSIARRFVEEAAPDTGPESAVGEQSASSCCGPSPSSTTRQRASCCGPSQAVEVNPSAGCCGSSQAAELTTAAARFYSSDELAGLPDTVTDASLGCGNPIAIAELKPGEVVLDLGSGGGIDCFLAAKRVGPRGRVIGLDMTPDMIRLAQRNAKKVGAKNVEFRYGEMEDMPLPDESVDAIISNCVINLSPDKDAVFHEAFRVLRPEGRISVSDVVVDGDLPKPIRDNMNAWAGCLAGALDESAYLAKLRAAGFEDVQVISRDYAIADQFAEAEDLLAGSGISAGQLAQKVASIKVRAYKPAGCC